MKILSKALYPRMALLLVLALASKTSAAPHGTTCAQFFDAALVDIERAHTSFLNLERSALNEVVANQKSKAQVVQAMERTLNIAQKLADNLSKNGKSVETRYKTEKKWERKIISGPYRFEIEASEFKGLTSHPDQVTATITIYPKSGQTRLGEIEINRDWATHWRGPNEVRVSETEGADVLDQLRVLSEEIPSLNKSAIEAAIDLVKLSEKSQAEKIMKDAPWYEALQMIQAADEKGQFTGNGKYFGSKVKQNKTSLTISGNSLGHKVELVVSKSDLKKGIVKGKFKESGGLRQNSDWFSFEYNSTTHEFVADEGANLHSLPDLLTSPLRHLYYLKNAQENPLVSKADFEKIAADERKELIEALDDEYLGKVGIQDVNVGGYNFKIEKLPEGKTDEISDAKAKGKIAETIRNIDRHLRYDNVDTSVNDEVVSIGGPRYTVTLFKTNNGDVIGYSISAFQKGGTLDQPPEGKHFESLADAEKAGADLTRDVQWSANLVFDARGNVIKKRDWEWTGW